MFKILSMALALTLFVANITHAATQPPAKPFQDKPNQEDQLKQPDKQPPHHDQKMTPSDNRMAPPNDRMTPPDGKVPNKGKRPHQKPDKKPGGDKVPPEFQ